MMDLNVRSLSQQYARGEIDRETYRHLRRELLDGLQEGHTSLFLPPPTLPPAPPGILRSPAAPPAWRVTPVTFALGVGGLALLVYLVSDPSPTEDAKKTVSPPPATTSNPDRAGTVLLQALVDEADWSLLRIAGFQRLWSALSAPAREEAMRSLALRRLADRLRAQVLELRALANLNHDPNLATALAPLHALAETLRLTEEAKLASAGASLRPIRTGPAPAIAAPAVPPAIAAPAKPATAKAVVRPTNHTALLAAGEAWLANLHQDKQTIQLISLQHLDNILQILTAHPKVNAQIIRNHGPGAPYRVLMGEFDTVALAEQAIRALPEDLRRQLGQPIVRAVAAARKDATRKDAPRIGSGAVKK